MEIAAVLDHLHLSSPDPGAIVRFYGAHFAMTPHAAGEAIVLTGPGRRFAVSPGPVNRLKYAAWRFPDRAALLAYRARVAPPCQVALPSFDGFDPEAFAVVDPDGNVTVFTAGTAPVVAATAAVPAAVTQHFALRTPDPSRLLAFYRDTLHFTLSDRVEDGEGTLRACFLRTDSLHHALALFGAPVSRFDHQSSETPGWGDLRDWADHMARLKTPMAWGVGRHGPGNDVFFMVADPDGNLAEISSEIEVCGEGRPVGLWPHEERTLNLWGRAIMRS
jgi:catechol 2,3-dioxygenase-like lactoylglutathione lyase family enzyme